MFAMPVPRVHGPRRSGSAALLAVLAVLLAPAAALAGKVTFVLTSDIYQMAEETTQDGKQRGGFARLAAVVKAEREKGGTVVVHAGDTLSPSLMSGFDQGAHIIALLNLIGPDVFVPGNHEFDFGKAVFLTRMTEARFPKLAANLRGADGAVLNGFADHRIMEVDGVRIGIVGLAFDDTPRASTSEDLQFRPSVATLREEARRLREAGADFIVAVAHAEREQQREMMATGVVDLVLGGHNHDLFVNYDGRAALVETAYDALYVTAIDVDITIDTADGKRTARWWPQFRIIDTATVDPEPKLLAAVEGYQKDLDTGMLEPLGTLAVEWDSRNVAVRTRETAIGNFLADAIRTRTNADVGLMNGGGIRAGKVYPSGSPVSRRDILEELPFGNRVVTVELTGKELLATLENGLARLPEASGRFLQVSGLTLEADVSRPAGSRLVSVEVGGKPLDPARRYVVAVNDFLARGGDGNDAVRDAKPLLPVDDSPLLANEAMVYLRALGTVKTGVENRIVFK